MYVLERAGKYRGVTAEFRVIRTQVSADHLAERFRVPAPEPHARPLITSGFIRQVRASDEGMATDLVLAPTRGGRGQRFRELGANAFRGRGSLPEHGRSRQ